MVHINELYITEDSKNLIIDVLVKEEEYFENVYLDSIVIDSSETYLKGSSSSNPIYYKEIEGNTKHIRLVLTSSEVPILSVIKKGFSELFFVYINVKGTPAINTPCGEDKISTLATVINLYPLYLEAMLYIGELSNNCQEPLNFIDFILRLKAFEISLKTGHYIEAVNFYKEFFKDDKKFITKGGCSCGHK